MNYRAFSNFYLCYTFFFLAVRFYLIYWKEEEGVSVHSEDEIKFVEDDREGAPCTVMFGKIAYLGAVACRG